MIGVRPVCDPFRTIFALLCDTNELQYVTVADKLPRVTIKPNENEEDQMATAYCPECEQMVKLGAEPMEGQRVTCSNCGTMLEVVSLEPLGLDWAYVEPADDEESWDWDQEEDRS